MNTAPTQQHQHHQNSAQAHTHCYWRGHDLYLNLYVVPRAKADRIAGIYADKLKIQIAAPANDGKANVRLVKFLASVFAVPQNSVTILKGDCAQYKLVKIQQPKAIPTILDLR
jgi:uncharacterized protein